MKRTASPAFMQNLRDVLEMTPLLVVLLGLFGGALVLGLLQSFGYAPGSASTNFQPPATLNGFGCPLISGSRWA